MQPLYRILPVLLCVLTLGQLRAEVSFGNLDLDAGTGLLFQAQVDSPGYGVYKTAYLADTARGELQALSYFPEQVTWLPATQELQIQNRFGVYRFSFPFTKARVLERFPGFAAGGEIKPGKLAVSLSSPDGAWLVYQRATSAAWAELVLLNVASGAERVIGSGLGLSLDNPGALWSPESDIVVYSKNSELYYWSISQGKSGKVLDEKLRRIGPGAISSVQWGNRNQLVYVSGSMVYEILAAEMFTRSLYQDFLKIGRIVGRLPHDFDVNFDRFWMSPDSQVLLLAKGNQHLYVYPMNEETHPDGHAWEFPLLSLPRATILTQVLWSNDGLLNLVFDSPDRTGAMRSLLYRLDLTIAKPNYILTESPHIRSITLNDEKALVLYDSSVELINFRDWRTLKTWQHPDPLHTFTVGGDKVLIVGAWYSELIDTASDVRTFLFFSQSESLGFDAETGLVSQKSRAQTFSLSEGRWVPRSPLKFRTPQTANTIQRAYAENLYAGSYQNIIMLRRVKDVGTKSLFNAPKTAYETIPKTDESMDFEYFTHGSRIRGRNVSLTFNAIDSADGLDEILQILNYYKIKATFFVNGEFLRRYPAAARQLAASGQEIGSLFYTWFNMADQRYRLDTQFLKLGLARNEDEYRDITGKELTLLWRTPYNVVNKAILDASKELRYTLVGADVDSLDTVLPGRGGSESLYRSAPDLVERILAEKKPGSVISMTLGRPSDQDAQGAERKDYLFRHLDVLINGLLEKGYTIVPVSRLIEAAR